MKTILLSLLLIFTTLVFAQTPNVLLLNPVRLMETKKKIEQKDPVATQWLTRLTNQADTLLNATPFSVMEKAFTPESGNKHDYMSQAPYFWYDSTKPNGLPYVNRDGQRNPEIYKITDRTYIGKLEEYTRTLSLAWYFTGNEKYAAKATLLLHTWFLNESTKMNPNLNFGQAVPGVNSGRGIGIIETIALTGIADAAGLLTGSASWTKTDHAALQKWYADYLEWMLTSKNGKAEHVAKNNHGSWYFAQAIDFALFAGDTKRAEQLVGESKDRLDSQLTKEGTQPLELRRTNALSYSTFNLRAWFTVATLAARTGVDLWNFKTSNNVTLRNALDWLTPYAISEKTWTYDQIVKYNPTEIHPLLVQASGAYKDPTYLTKAEKIKANVTMENLYRP